MVNPQAKIICQKNPVSSRKESDFASLLHPGIDQKQHVWSVTLVTVWWWFPCEGMGRGIRQFHTLQLGIWEVHIHHYCTRCPRYSLWRGETWVEILMMKMSQSIYTVEKMYSRQRNQPIKRLELGKTCSDPQLEWNILELRQV